MNAATHARPFCDRIRIQRRIASAVALAAVAAGTLLLAAPASAAISGLTPQTTYHFRIVATNAIGTTAGPDQTFTTAASTPVVTPPPSSCKAGFVKRGGKCVKRHHKRKHHRRSHQ